MTAGVKSRASDARGSLMRARRELAHLRRRRRVVRHELDAIDPLECTRSRTNRHDEPDRGTVIARQRRAFMRTASSACWRSSREKIQLAPDTEVRDGAAGSRPETRTR